MKKINKRAAIWLCAAATVAALGLCACSSGDAGSQDGAAEGDAAVETVGIVNAENPDAASLLAVPTHPEGMFTSEIEANATCMQSACHDADELVEDGVGVLMDADSLTVANPHANHQYLDCVDCHSVSEQPVLYCNSCHEFTLAEGWANPLEGAAELTYEFDASGAYEFDYAASGRDATELPAEATDGPTGLQKQAEALGLTVEEYVAQMTAQFAAAFASGAGGASAA
ncbi:MAG: cytochrome c3 family protein [Eggerthellaceae bacterium]|nr:cytochrome c3 family protein [Eggerthellaceae bacterium]